MDILTCFLAGVDALHVNHDKSKGWHQVWNLHSTWKMVAGRWVSFWKGFLANAMLLSGRVSKRVTTLFFLQEKNVLPVPDITKLSPFKSCHTVDGRNPAPWSLVKDGKSYISTGAGFQPSIVSLAFATPFCKTRSFCQTWKREKNLILPTTKYSFKKKSRPQNGTREMVTSIVYP